MAWSLHDPKSWRGGLDLRQHTEWGDVQLNPFQSGFNANPFSGNKGQSGAKPINYGDYQYGSNPGDDAAQALASQYGAQAGAQYGASVAGQGQLGQFYQGQLNGTGPSLAAQQAKASTDQSIQAQQATAASARGSLGQAGAQEQAAMLGAQARQAGAQAAVQGRVGEEYNAAQGLGQLSATQQQAAQGWAGQQQNVWTGEQNAKNAQGNYLLGQGAQAQQGSEYGGTQLVNLAGSVFGGAGAAAGAADADLREPGGGAGETLREERAHGSHPGWILAVDHQTGHMGKVDIKPLSPEEHAQARGEHGAGPLNSPDRAHTDFNDIGLGGAYSSKPTTLGPRGRFGDAPGNLGGTLAPQLALAPSIQNAAVPNGTTAAPRQLAIAPTVQNAALGPQIQGTPLAEAQQQDRDYQALVNSHTTGPGGTFKPEEKPQTYNPGDLVTGKPATIAAGGGSIPLPASQGGGGGGPARTGFVDTLDPADRARLESGVKAESRAGAALGQDLSNEEKQAAANDQRTAAQLDANAAGMDTFEKQQAHAQKDLLYQKDQASRDLDKLGKDYGWHPSTATRVRYGIASFLGALGAGLAHTQNFAAQQINDNINRDLDKQQKQIEGAKGRVADLDSTLAQAYRQTGDMRQAKVVAQLASLDKVKAEGSAYAHASHSQTVKDNQALLDAKISQQQAELLASHMKMVTTGGTGAGAGDARKQLIARAQKLVDEGKFDNVNDARKFAAGELGLADAGGLQAAGKAGAGKVAAPSAQLQGALEALPAGAGEDFYDRNAPNFARSTESLTNQARLAGAARAYLKAIGGREPPPGSEGDQAAIQTAIGRPTPEAVQAFRHAAAHVAQVTANAGPSAAEPAEQP